MILAKLFVGMELEPFKLAHCGCQALNNVPNARSFVGPTQHCKFTSDYTIFDPLHGLTWKVCAQGQTGSDCSGSVAAPINWANANAGLSGSCSELNTLNSGEGYAGRTN